MLSRSLVIFSLLIIFFLGCKEDEVEMTTAPCMEGQETPLYSIQIRNNEFKPISYAFLSTDDGEVIRTKEVNSGVTSIEDYCGVSNKYHLTTVRENLDETNGRTYFHFRTYLALSDGTIIDLSHDENLESGESPGVNITLNQVESVQRVEFNRKYDVSQFYEIAPLAFLSQSIQMPKRRKYYTKIWANEESPRFCFFQYSDDDGNNSNTFDYDQLVSREDTVRIELIEDIEWRYYIDGVISLDPLKLVEIDNCPLYPFSFESDHINTYLPAQDFDLKGYFVYLSGSPEPYHIKFHKYFEEIPSQIIPKQFTVRSIVKNTQEISLEPIPNADVCSLLWLTYSNSDIYYTWSVLGAMDEFSFKKPQVPDEILDHFNFTVNDIEWNIGGGFWLQYSENIHSYEDYLSTFYGGNNTPNTEFLKSIEEYVGLID